MTPKEKAEELIRKYYSFGINKEGQTLSWYECKQCAIIAIDEILSFIEDDRFVFSWKDYYLEVKQEIEKL